MSSNNTPDLSSEIQQLIDLKFGNDIKSLKGITKLYDDIVKRKDQYEKEMQVPSSIAEADSTDNPSEYQQGIIQAMEQLERCENVKQRKEQVAREVDELLAPSKDSCNKFKRVNEDIVNLQKYVQYMKYVSKINETSENVQQSILSDSMVDACQAFKRLVTQHGCLIENHTKCRNITQHLHNTIMFWYKILKEKLSKELKELLKLVQWPFINAKGPNKIPIPKTNNETLKPEDPNARLESVIGNLLSIQLPKHVRNSGKGNEATGDASADKTTDDQDDLKILLPFIILLRPLKQRFHYHFTGNKNSNVLSKPELYLTQVANWIEYHAGFLEETIQPILDKHKHQYVDALVMFTEGLLQLVNCKMAVDIDSILEDDQVYSHFVDEVLIFDKDLRNIHDIPKSTLKIHSPLNILTIPKCLDKWLNVESAWAQDRLETLLTVPECWKAQLSSLSNLEGDPDESKVPECAEEVVRMILNVTDRYKNLPNWDDKIKFLNFQLSILDEFRLRITQVIRSIESSSGDDKTYAIINTSRYIQTVLEDWADNLFFLEMKDYKDKKAAEKSILPNSFVLLADNPTQQPATKDQTVFDSTIALYEKMYEDTLMCVQRETINDLYKSCYSYITDSWSEMEERSEQINMIVSPSICMFLSSLQEKLNNLECKLSAYLFSKLWRSIAEELDTFLFNEVVVKNKFNLGGAAQLQHDMKDNLFPLFRSYTSKPDRYFKRVKEACLLLNLQLGSAMLLHSAVTSGDGEEGVRTLTEMGIHLIKEETAANLLKRRVDWPLAEENL